MTTISKLITELGLDSRQYNQGFDAAQQKAKTSTQGIVGSVKGIEDGFSKVGLVAGGVAGAFFAVKGAVDNIVNPVVEYADQVRRLQQLLGTTAEESSILAVASDDAKVSQEDLERAMKAAIRNGLEPNIDGLRSLSAEFNAIQDPIQRSQWMMENFGKTGTELNEFMRDFNQLTEDARTSGLIFNEKDLEETREYEKAVDNLGDSFLALKIAVSKEVIPALADGMTALSNYVGAARTIKEAYDEGRVSWLEATAAIFKMQLTGYTAADAMRDYGKAIEEADNAAHNFSNTVTGMKGVIGDERWQQLHPNSRRGTIGDAGWSMSSTPMFQATLAPIQVNYSPTLSLADSQTLERTLAPIIERTVRNIQAR